MEVSYIDIGCVHVGPVTSLHIFQPGIVLFKYLESRTWRIFFFLACCLYLFCSLFRNGVLKYIILVRINTEVMKQFSCVCDSELSVLKAWVLFIYLFFLLHLSAAHDGIGSLQDSKHCIVVQTLKSLFKNPKQTLCFSLHQHSCQVDRLQMRCIIKKRIWAVCLRCSR